MFTRGTPFGSLGLQSRPSSPPPHQPRCRPPKSRAPHSKVPQGCGNRAQKCLLIGNEGSFGSLYLLSRLPLDLLSPPVYHGRTKGESKCLPSRSSLTPTAPNSSASHASPPKASPSAKAITSSTSRCPPARS